MSWANGILHMIVTTGTAFLLGMMASAVGADAFQTGAVTGLVAMFLAFCLRVTLR